MARRVRPSNIRTGFLIRRDLCISCKEMWTWGALQLISATSVTRPHLTTLISLLSTSFCNTVISNLTRSLVSMGKAACLVARSPSRILLTLSSALTHFPSRLTEITELCAAEAGDMRTPHIAFNQPAASGALCPPGLAGKVKDKTVRRARINNTDVCAVDIDLGFAPAASERFASRCRA